MGHCTRIFLCFRLLVNFRIFVQVKNLKAHVPSSRPRSLSENEALEVVYRSLLDASLVHLFVYNVNFILFS